MPSQNQAEEDKGKENLRDRQTGRQRDIRQMLDLPSSYYYIKTF